MNPVRFPAQIQIQSCHAPYNTICTLPIVRFNPVLPPLNRVVEPRGLFLNYRCANLFRRPQRQRARDIEKTVVSIFQLHYKFIAIVIHGSLDVYTL